MVFRSLDLVNRLSERRSRPPRGDRNRKRAKPHDRTEIHLRDLRCFGRPVRLVLRKRRWRCATKSCVRKTWTEKIGGVMPRQLLTHRAGAEVTRQVGQLCRSVASVAFEYGVGWDTVMAAVVRHGTPLVDDDEHSYPAATPSHRTIYSTSLVDLDRRRAITSTRRRIRRHLTPPRSQGRIRKRAPPERLSRFRRDARGRPDRLPSSRCAAGTRPTQSLLPGRQCSSREVRGVRDPPAGLLGKLRPTVSVPTDI